MFNTLFAFPFHPCSPMYQIQSSPFVRTGWGPIVTAFNLVPSVSLFTFPRSVGTRFALRLPITSLNNPTCPKSYKHRFFPSYILTLSRARFRRCSTHVSNLTNELSTAKERRLNQFGAAVLVW